MKRKLAIITTHPIQYYAPLFRELAKSAEIEIKVFYTKGEVKEKQFEPDFGKSIAWDIPLLEGYCFTFLENKSLKKEGFWSIENPSLISEIEYWNAQAIWVFGWSYQSHLKTMWHFKGKIPVFFRGDSTLLDTQSGLKSLIRTLFLTVIYTFVDKAIYVGEANKNYYLKHGLKPNQLVFAPHAIENQRFKDENGDFSKKAKQWKTELGILTNEKVVLFVGKFIGKKNPLLLLEVYKSLHLSNAHLVFVGNGELEEKMRNLALKHKNIHFIPFQNQSQMPTVYRLGDVFCLPSSGPGETWGLAVNEAMASGCAVLVSNKCGCAFNLVQNDVNGYIFESNNEEELSIKLAKLLEKDLTDLKQSALSLIKSYSYEAIIKALEDAF